MKIPIQNVYWGGGERYIVPVTIVIKNFRLSTDAIIDTGSPWTVIMESDLKKTRIPYSKYPKVNRVNLIVQIDLLDLGECTLIFKDVENKPVEFKQRVFGGMLVSRNVELVQSIPSFIGKDFLDKHNLYIGKKDESGRRYLQD